MWQFDPSPNPDPRNSASGTDGSAKERVMDSRLELVAQKLKSLYATGHPYDDNSPDTPRSGDSAGATNGWSKGLCFKHRTLQLWKSHPEKSVPQTSMATQSWPHGSKNARPQDPLVFQWLHESGFLDLQVQGMKKILQKLDIQTPGWPFVAWRSGWELLEFVVADSPLDPT